MVHHVRQFKNVVVSHEGFRRLTLPLGAVSSAKQPEGSSEWKGITLHCCKALWPSWNAKPSKNCSKG